MLSSARHCRQRTTFQEKGERGLLYSIEGTPPNNETGPRELLRSHSRIGVLRTLSLHSMNLTLSLTKAGRVPENEFSARPSRQRSTRQRPLQTAKESILECEARRNLCLLVEPCNG